MVVDEPLMMKGVDRNVSILIDVDDKAAALEQEDTPENRLKVILLGMHSLIGECSNCSTTYHNKLPHTITMKKEYERYVDILSITCGRAIDAAKTGLAIKIPFTIAKYGKPVPYFMKHAKEYYARQKDLRKGQSNMNRLCWEIEKFEKKLKWFKRDRVFDHRLMMDESIEVDQSILYALEEIYKNYNKEAQQMRRDEMSIQRELGGKDKFKLCWDSFYDRYREQSYTICPDKKMLVNALVVLCYEMYPRGTTAFLWNIAGEFIADNVKQVETHLPALVSDNGDFKYLGKPYRMESTPNPNIENFAGCFSHGSEEN